MYTAGKWQGIIKRDGVYIFFELVFYPKIKKILFQMSCLNVQNYHNCKVFDSINLISVLGIHNFLVKEVNVCNCTPKRRIIFFGKI